MEKLSTALKLDSDAIKAPNLTSRFSAEDLKTLGDWVWNGYNRDKLSRYKWEKRTEAAMDLAMQIQKDKSFPWPGCSNVAFPLVTIGVLQFHSRAYPALVSPTEVVKCRTIGEDLDGQKEARAQRISTHMSWQCLEQDQSWEEQHDRLLINLPCVGTAFKKSYPNASKGYNVSELVLAKDLVLDYWAKSVEDCPRKTHIIPYFRNDIHEKVLRGTFRDVLSEAWYTQPAAPQTTTQTTKHDNRTGQTPPQTDETTPFTGLEQHCRMDLDQDGYAEPYIITIEETSHAVLRIVTGFDREEDIERVTVGPRKGKIIQIRALEYFTKYGFIPSPDGGIYDIGFGVLLGPLNESVNSLLNQLVDAGTMRNTAGGFLGRGAKIRGGVYTFAPFQWQRVDSSGDDLRKSIFPLPTNEPSVVLFQLLGLLIEYTNRISGSTDIMVGENVGQNTPAETSRMMVQQGEKVYNAIFKRCWRGMKDEFKKLYVLNGLTLPFKSYFGDNQSVLREDYLGNPEDVVPAADPNVTSEQMMIAQARMVKESAMSSPGGYDPEAVERFYLRAMKVPAIDTLYPGLKKFPPGQNPKIAIEEAKTAREQMRLHAEQAQFAAELMEEQRLNNAQINKLQAEAVKALADIEGDAQDRQINSINTMIGLLKQRNDGLSMRIEAALRMLEIKSDKEKEAKKDGA